MSRGGSRRLVSLLVGAAVAVTGVGCGSLGAEFSSVHAVDLEQPQMQQFAVAAMTDLERDVRIESSDRKREKLTPVLFWSGIAVGTAASVGAIAFGVLGFVTKGKLASGYEDGGMTVDERDQLVNRGEAYNTTAVVMTSVAVISYALSIVTYGVDWNRCGPLVEKKRRCKELGLGPP